MASRIVEGIKELWQGKEEPEYRYRYDQHRSPESRSNYGYPSQATSVVRGEYGRPYGEALERKPYGSKESVRGEYRTPYGTNGEYRKPYSSLAYGSSIPVLEFSVPMCCDKCKEKVEEELGEVEGVETVRCDQTNGRVIVTGVGVDVERAIKKCERAVKKKCELISYSDGVSRSSHYPSTNTIEFREARTGGLVRSNSYGKTGRGQLGRLPSFGRVTHYDGAGIGQREDYGPQDYNNFRRMPSFSKHRHHEAEYISTIDERTQPRDSRRDFNNVRRMPSFNRHRHHDAEYVVADDRDYAPRTFYEDSGSKYTSSYNERPVFRSQVSFSKLPVGNPNYVKHIIDPY